MKNFKWKIYEGRKFISAGNVDAESEREAMSQVLAQGSTLPIEMDKSYSITVGDSMMSSYGDEFEHSAQVTGWGSQDEKADLYGDYLFKPKVSDIAPGPPEIEVWNRIAKKMAESTIGIKNLHEAARASGISAKELGEAVHTVSPCQKFSDGQHRWIVASAHSPCLRECDCGVIKDNHDMNGTLRNVANREDHAQCIRCGFVDPQGLGTHDYRGPDLDDPLDNKGQILPSVTIKNGHWTDPFTDEQAANIRKIVTLQGLDPYLIQSAVRNVIAWKFTLSNGGYMMISDEMISKFKG